jgi:hypothetical protein
MGDSDKFRSELGMTRRDLLRRGAIVGGTLLWAAPAIQSIAKPAFASLTVGSTPHYCCFCTGGTTTAQGGQCLNDGIPPSATACRDFCTGLGACNWSWCDNRPTAYGCVPPTGCEGTCVNSTSGPTGVGGCA